jgi:hypothetical protein
LAVTRRDLSRVHPGLAAVAPLPANAVAARKDRAHANDAKAPNKHGFCVFHHVLPKPGSQTGTDTWIGRELGDAGCRQAHEFELKTKQIAKVIFFASMDELLLIDIPSYIHSSILCLFILVATSRFWVPPLTVMLQRWLAACILPPSRLAYLPQSPRCWARPTPPTSRWRAGGKRPPPAWQHPNGLSACRRRWDVEDPARPRSIFCNRLYKEDLNFVKTKTKRG